MARQTKSALFRWLFLVLLGAMATPWCAPVVGQESPPLPPLPVPVRALPLATADSGQLLERLGKMEQRLDWLTPKELGRYTLLSRAKAADGSAQPDKHDPNYGTYIIIHPLPTEVFVDGPAVTSG